MASVKRYDFNGWIERTEEPDGLYVLASDYDRLVEVVKEIGARQQDLINTSSWGETIAKSDAVNEAIEKALALIGEGGEEGKSNR